MENESLGIGSRIEHPHFGRGVVVDVASEFYIIWFKSQNATKGIAKDYDFKILEKTEGEPASASSITLADIERAVENILDQRLHDVQLVPMAGKWNNGMMILKPNDASLQAKEIPIETFFHKIVMVRDRLRLIEQKINAHKGLTDEDKVDLQQYVTMIYGSLTTFNVLFKESIHQFRGAGGKE
jgi:predicted nuclease of predicted toxin-antitoxin system